MLTLDSTGFPSTICMKVMFCSSVCVAETLRYTFSYQKSESNPSNAFHVKYDLNTQCAERPHHEGKSNASSTFQPTYLATSNPHTFTDLFLSEVLGKDGEEHKGAQIDLIIDRGDKTINLCEMKFTNKPFAISAEYAGRLLERRDTFREVTGTNKSLQLTMVTSAGLVHNAGWQSINNEVDVDDLFHV